MQATFTDVQLASDYFLLILFLATLRRPCWSLRWLSPILPLTFVHQRLKNSVTELSLITQITQQLHQQLQKPSKNPVGLVNMAFLQQSGSMQRINSSRSAAPCLAPCRPSLRSRCPASISAAAAPAKAGIIDGKKIAEDIRKEIAAEVQQLQKAAGRAPGLAVVLVGSRKDSETYVRSKKKACAEVGFESFGTDLPEDASEEDLLKVVAAYNADPKVDGILVQLPLPKHINEQTVLDAISIDKDVDGFHPMNIGSLAMRGRDPMYVSCTPKGCMELLKRSGVEVKGKTAVVVGRSNIVGLPAALLLQNADATVTMVHSRTPNAEQVVRQADIVIAACGKAEMVKGSWIKPGAIVIDVGINAVDDPSAKRGYRLVGDVAFAEAAEQASLITPVPGGVGPMTIAMLLQNTVEGYKRRIASR